MFLAAKLYEKHPTKIVGQTVAANEGPVGKRFCRNFLKRRGFSFKRTQGQKQIIHPRTYSKANEEITKLKEDYPDFFLSNFDESCVTYHATGKYSFSSDSNMPRAKNTINDKARVSVASFISQNGDFCFKSIIIDKNLTNGMTKSTKVFEKKVNGNTVTLRLQPNGQYHAVTPSGYMVRCLFFAILEQYNSFLMRKKLKTLLLVDNAHSHHSCLATWKEWKKNQGLNGDVIYSDKKTFSNIIIVYLPALTTSSAQDGIPNSEILSLTRKSTEKRLNHNP